MPASKVQFFTARIPDNSFDKAKLQRLEKKNAELRAELNDYKKAYETERRRNDQIATIGNAAREKQQAEAERRYKEYEDHIAKLERALIEATLR